MSNKTKHKHIIPFKGHGKCATCNTELNKESSAIECNICEKWIYGEHLDLSPGEYKLLSKMMMPLTWLRSCPASNISPPPPPSSEKTMAAKLASVNNNSLKTFREDLKKEFATTSQLPLVFSQLRTDFSAQVSAIASRVSPSELPLAPLTESNVCQIACFECQHFERCLNIIEYGIPPRQWWKLLTYQHDISSC